MGLRKLLLEATAVAGAAFGAAAAQDQQQHSENPVIDAITVEAPANTNAERLVFNDDRPKPPPPPPEGPNPEDDCERISCDF